MKKKPNILLIMVDQQRYDCIGCSGLYPVSTPNIDRIASEGMRFTDAYTPLPVCAPSRQALLNGRRPESFGALWNYDFLPTPVLEPRDYSWTKEIKGFGYRTAFIGKWHVNPAHGPDEFGYDHYTGEEAHDSYIKLKYPDIGYANGWRGESSPLRLKDSKTHWLADRAVEKIREYIQEGLTWHIRLDFPDPHLPCRPSFPFSEMYRPEDIPRWKNFRDMFVNKPYIQRQQLYNWQVEDCGWEDWAPVVARYYGMVSQIDDAIGKVLDAVDERGLSRDTIVIYTSDHGDMCGSHGMVDKHYVLYDDVVKVPLAVRWPDLIKKGTVCGEFVCNCLDIPPTICEIMELEPKDFFHGKSLMPLMKCQKPASWRQQIVSTSNGQQFGLYTQRMIRTKRWKYIWNCTDVDELYNLEEDPGEINNLVYSAECRDILGELRKKLYDELLETDDFIVKSEWMKYQLQNGKKM